MQHYTITGYIKLFLRQMMSDGGINKQIDIQTFQNHYDNTFKSLLNLVENILKQFTLFHDVIFSKDDFWNFA
jgi:hypothetical protein